MTVVFIFADQIRDALAAGKEEIEVAENARISAAAADLIRENNLRLTHVKKSETAPQEQVPEPQEEVTELAEIPVESSQPDTESTAGEASPDPDSGISDADLEDIVNRVIERFQTLKGIEPERSGAGAPPRAPTRAEETDDDDMVICRCEEITKGEIKDAIRNGMRTLNGIKRITRAGMGLCQGQTCQRLVAMILSEELGLGAAEIDPTTARGPVRPLRLKVFANR
jgi:bacterioferritin-associated ferredoxin